MIFYRDPCAPRTPAKRYTDGDVRDPGIEYFGCRETNVENR